MSIITLDSEIANGSDFQRMQDYQSILANDARCAGIWNFDRSAWTLDGNRRIMSVANMKTGGRPLTQSDSSKRAYTAVDPDLADDVARFVGTEQHFYLADGLSFVSKNPFTIIALCRPAFQADIQLIAGSYSGSNDVAALFQSGLPNTFRMLIQERTAIQEGRAGLNRVMAASTLQGAKLAKLSVNDQLAVTAAGGAASDPPGTQFFVSHPGAAFTGTIRQIQLYPVDLLADANVDLLNRALAYADELGGGAV